jgi:hypothetical protein
MDGGKDLSERFSVISYLVYMYMGHIMQELK